MRNFKQTTRLITIVLALTGLANAYAGNLYRYKDENGTTVMGLNVPPHLIRNGYEILNNAGRVVEVVPPALTAEQIANRNSKEAEKLRLAEAARKQRAQDQALLKLYSHPNDAVRVLKRKLQDIDDFIKLKSGNILVVKGQLEQEETKAANLERTGKKVSESILTRIYQQREKIIEIEQEISVKRNEVPTIKSEFDRIIRRLETITQKKAKDYPLEKETKTEADS